MKSSHVVFSALLLIGVGCGSSNNGSPAAVARVASSELTGNWKSGCTPSDGANSSSWSEISIRADATIVSTDYNYANATCDGPTPEPTKTTMNYMVTSTSTKDGEPKKIVVSVTDIVEEKPSNEGFKTESIGMEFTVISEAEITTKTVAATFSGPGIGSRSLTADELKTAPTVTFTRQ